MIRDYVPTAGDPVPVGRAKVGTAIAAALVGLGIGTLVPPDPVTLPAVGRVPGPAVGVAGLLAGAGLFLWTRRVTSDCGCSGECGCS